MRVKNEKNHDNYTLKISRLHLLFSLIQVDGRVVVTYGTDGDGSSSNIRNDDILVSDGQYHIVHFIRTKDRGTLLIDGNELFNVHACMFQIDSSFFIYHSEEDFGILFLYEL